MRRRYYSTPAYREPSKKEQVAAVEEAALRTSRQLALASEILRSERGEYMVVRQLEVAFAMSATSAASAETEVANFTGAGAPQPLPSDIVIFQDVIGLF
uniref:Uncharacterized protein n=1 Tax=viral metagenome TaxID=1070528 RepID=A0A6M3XX27_9ZZZZ